MRGSRKPVSCYLATTDHFVSMFYLGRVFYIVLTTTFLHTCRFIRPGTKIISDCWKAYNGIPDLEGYNFTHSTVNHKKGFKNKKGEHTNSIEATWRTTKESTPHRRQSKEFLQEYLFCRMWRQQNLGCTWWAILQALREIRYEDGPQEN